MKRQSLFFFLVGFFWVLSSHAQKKPEATNPNSTQVGDKFYQKKTVYDFNNDTIAGDLTRPDGEYIEARRGLKHQRLIKLREDWKEKLNRSVHDL